jgi:dolichol-phosphate mannosyltransferase
LKQYALFLGYCAIGAAVQLSVVYVLVESFGIFYALALVMAVCIASISNYLLNKKITFGEKIWG